MPPLPASQHGAALPCRGPSRCHGWEKQAWGSPGGAQKSQLSAQPAAANYNAIYGQKPTTTPCELGRQSHFHAQSPLTLLHPPAAASAPRSCSLKEAAPGLKGSGTCWNEGQDPFVSAWVSVWSERGFLCRHRKGRCSQRHSAPGSPRSRRWEQLGMMVVHSTSGVSSASPDAPQSHPHGSGGWISSLGAWDHHGEWGFRPSRLRPSTSILALKNPALHEVRVNSPQLAPTRQGQKQGPALPLPCCPVAAAENQRFAETPLGSARSSHSAHQTPQDYLLRRHVHLLSWSSLALPQETYENRETSGTEGKPAG